MILNYLKFRSKRPESSESKKLVKESTDSGKEIIDYLIELEDSGIS